MKLTVDVAVTEGNRVLLVKRKWDPYAGYWALPGGFVEEDETVENAAVREVKEETGLDVKLLNIWGVLSDPGRDPRMRTVSIVYNAEKIGGEMATSRETEEVEWFDVMPERIAFDHAKVIKDVMGNGV